MKQKIYKIIDKKFESFINNNRTIFSDMKIGEIVKVNDSEIVKEHFLCSKDMLDAPFNVAYFGKLDSSEGSLLLFFNKEMEKIYSYYDVM